jgi:hypothetical protein
MIDPSIYIIWWTTPHGVTLTETMTNVETEMEVVYRIEDLVKLGNRDIQWTKVDPHKDIKDMGV